MRIRRKRRTGKSSKISVALSMRYRLTLANCLKWNSMRTRATKFRWSNRIRKRSWWRSWYWLAYLISHSFRAKNTVSNSLRILRRYTRLPRSTVSSFTSSLSSLSIIESSVSMEGICSLILAWRSNRAKRSFCSFSLEANPRNRPQLGRKSQTILISPRPLQVFIKNRALVSEAYSRSLVKVRIQRTTSKQP